MDLAELGVVATQDGVKEAADGLDRLSTSASSADESVGKFNAKSGETKTATDSMNGSVDAGVASFAALGPMILGAVAALASFAAAALSLQKFVDATSEAEFGQAQLAAALKSTKGASGQTIESLNEYASALQNASNFEDDTINKAQSILLTFTKIGKDVFPLATQATADLAARMGTDLQSATLQVGKALNDPIKGIGALSRAGIQFTEDQKSMIEGFVNANNIIGAQKIILQELETQFGGSALAARETLGGAIQSLTNAFGNLFEVSGPASEELRVAIEALIKAMDNKAFQDFVNTIGVVMFEALKLAVQGFTLLVNGISEFWGYAGPTIKEFSAIIYELASVVVPAIGEAFTVLWNIVEPIIQYFLEGWKDVYEVISQILGIQDQVKTPPTATAPAAANDNAAVPSTTAAKAAADTMNKGITTAANTASTTMNKSIVAGGQTAADTAQQAHEIGAAALDNSFGVGANSVAQATSDGAATMGAAIEANGNIMAAKFEGTGRNIYDLWNNWGDSFINSFGVSIGELLIDFQRAQTAQLEAQARLWEAQAELTMEQMKFLRDNGAMPGTANTGTGGSSSSGGTGGESTGGGGSLGGAGGDNGSGISTDSGIGSDSGGSGNRKNRRENSFNIGTDPAGPDKKKWQPLDERGNISLKIVNQNDPKDTLDNLNTSMGHRTLVNVMGSNRRKIRQILGVKG